jgi:hypothetical protein
VLHDTDLPFSEYPRCFDEFGQPVTDNGCFTYGQVNRVGILTVLTHVGDVERDTIIPFISVMLPVESYDFGHHCLPTYGSSAESTVVLSFFQYSASKVMLGIVTVSHPLMLGATPELSDTLFGVEQ